MTTMGWQVLSATRKDVTVLVDGVRHIMGWDLLRAAATQDDFDAAREYRAMLDAARKLAPPATKVDLARSTDEERRSAVRLGDVVRAEQCYRTMQDLVGVERAREIAEG
jgi:hypothetical protein